MAAPTLQAVGTLAATADTTAPFTCTVTLPAHAANDILVVVAGMNVASTLTIDAGWSTIVAAQSNANYSSAFWWKRAASAVFMCGILCKMGL